MYSLLKPVRDEIRHTNGFYGEVIPAGDRNTRLIIVGNLLHEDSLLMRIKEEIENKSKRNIQRIST
jgi:hypothetical protein